jgi:hypothetical protein
LNLPIDVIHGIQKDCGRISWIHNNTINRDMPFFIQRMMLINVPPACCQSVVPLPHKEYLARKMSKIIVILDHRFEFFNGILPK